MNLRDGLLATRELIGELNAFDWSDAEIIRHLNVSAKRLCSAAQYLEEFEMVSVPGPNYQEAWLTKQVEVILEIGYYSGTFFRLQRGDMRSVKQGSYAGGIPQMYYERRGTRTLTPTVVTSDIIPQIAPGTEGEGRTAIGVFPIPAQAWTCYAWYISTHPQMQNLLDPCFVPEQFKDAWTSYAVQKCKEKESAYGEAAYFQEMHKDGMAEFKAWSDTLGLSAGAMQWGQVAGMFGRPSTSVIVVADNPGYYNQ